jgi:hypothetical protein
LKAAKRRLSIRVWFGTKRYWIWFQQEVKMNQKEQTELKSDYIYVKDEQGVEYVCRIHDLKRTDSLTEEEKAVCMVPPGDG